jgi:hypothetical protein
MMIWELNTTSSGLLLLSLILIEEILRCSLFLWIRRFSSDILLCGLLSVLLVHLLLLSCYLFFMHSLLISGHINSKFFIFSFKFEFEVFLGLLIIIKKIKILYQKLTTSSSFLLLFFQKFLRCLVIRLVLIIVIKSIFLKTHFVIPAFGDTTIDN